MYSYFRLTGDNRLLLGGGTPITTYLKDAFNNPRVIRNGSSRTSKNTSRSCSDLSFMQFWPGQIDATRDLLPTIAKPPGHPLHPLHLRCGWHSMGCVHRQLHGAQHPWRGR